MEDIEDRTEEKEIRRAEDKDIPEIMRLLVEVNMVHHTIRPDLFKGPATKYTEDELKALIRKTEDPVFVLPGEEGKIAGYIFCRKEVTEDTALRCGMTTLYIDDLCVDESCRGMHVGERLYRFAAAYAKREGFYNVTLHVWGGNEGARKFYEKMGLRPQFTCLETVL